MCLKSHASPSSQLPRAPLIRLQQPDNGGVALGTFNELLQRQPTCEEEAKKRISSCHSTKVRVAHAANTHLHEHKSSCWSSTAQK